MALLSAGLVAFALTRLDLSRVGHALITAQPGWIVLAVALMAISLVFRSISWHEVLRAALPETQIDLGPGHAGDDDRRDGLGRLPRQARASPRAWSC